MKALWERSKLIVLDSLGSILILAALLLGWIPGPGGVPLLIAGLALLAVNHEWAERWLKKLREQGDALSHFIFRDHLILKAVYDGLGIAFLVIAFIISRQYTHSWTRTAAVMLVFAGLGLLLGNRQRWQRFTRWLKRRQ